MAMKIYYSKILNYYSSDTVVSKFTTVVIQCYCITTTVKPVNYYSDFLKITVVV